MLRARVRGCRYIFEYQYVVRAVPPPFNFPLLLWDACAAACRSRKQRQNLARMHLDDGYDEDPSFGAPPGVDHDEGLSLTRKYVQRYLQANADLSRESSLTTLAKRIEGNVDMMEERMMHEFEHIHNALIAPMGSGAKVEHHLRHISMAIDRMTKGKAGEAAGTLVAMQKDKVRESPPMNKQQSKVGAKSDRGAHGPVKV